MGLTRYLLVGLCTALAINALAFAASTAIPLPAADAWHFLDTFVRKALQGDLQLVDFFAQRGPGDHSQPLHRLVLLGHLGMFDLDFRIEALVGIVLGVATCSLLSIMLVRANGQRNAVTFLGAAAIFAVGLSLNATNVYTWSLVSLIWISLLLGVLYWMLAALPLRNGQYVASMTLATFAMALALDELAFPTFAAAVAALMFRDGLRRPHRSLLLLLGGGVGLVAARWSIHQMATGAADAAGAGRFSQLIDVLLGPESWRLLVGPLSDSLIHQEHLVAWFPSSSRGVQIAIALVLGVLHLAFWWHVFVSRERVRDTVFVIAVSMMLFFYASIAGIALSRVTEFGIEYVHQPRYTAVYQLNVIALILMFAGATRRPNAEGTWTGRMKGAVLVFLVAVLALQWPLTHRAWTNAKYIRNYGQEAAVALAKLGADPGIQPAPECPSILTVCSQPPAVRARILGLLMDNRLSIYSARFREANGFEQLSLQAPPPAQAATIGSPAPAGCSVTVLRHGPVRVAPGRPFNPQPNGRSAFWLMVPPETPAFDLEFEGKRVPLVRRAGVATYLVDDRQLAAINARRPLRFDVLCEGRKATSFDVAVD